MTLHAGQRYTAKDVQIGPPEFGLIAQAPKAADIAASVSRWLTAGQTRDDVYYFAVYFARATLPVGQILLHDMDRTTGESLVAYHIFDQQWRGRGIGTKALQLLQRFVASSTSLARLVIITSRHNVASQAVAYKCGFTYTGTPHEDPANGIVLTWNVRRLAGDIGAT